MCIVPQKEFVLKYKSFKMYLKDNINLPFFPYFFDVSKINNSEFAMLIHN